MLLSSRFLDFLMGGGGFLTGEATSPCQRWQRISGGNPKEYKEGKDQTGASIATREKAGMEAEAEPSSGERIEMPVEGTMIVFFDVETTVPSISGRSGGGGTGGSGGCSGSCRSGYSLLEFGAILVCPRRLVEVENYSTLIRPSDLNAISSFSIRCNGITRDSVASAPSFVDVADKVFSILQGKVWAGHNILKFDCVRIREAFAEIGRTPPEPMGTIDTLPLLTQRFGRRAGNMKMATLATYFGLGPQKHRSLDDVRLNLEVLKYCAAVLFVESSVTNVSPVKSLLSGKTLVENCDSQSNIRGAVSVDDLQGSTYLLHPDSVHCDHPLPNDDTTCLVAQVEQMKIDPLAKNFTNPSSCAGFLEPDDVSVDCITVSHSNGSPTVKKMHVFHLNVPLWLCCRGLVIRFGVSTKFTDYAGRPKLSILVDAPESLCRVLRTCDSLVQSSSRIHGSKSEWRHLLRKNEFTNSFTLRLHIPIVTNNDGNKNSAIYSTEIFRRDASGGMNRLVFDKFDADELDLLLAPGATIDAFLCFDTYDYLQTAGIRLVAKCLVVYSR